MTELNKRASLGLLELIVVMAADQEPYVWIF